MTFDSSSIMTGAEILAILIVGAMQIRSDRKNTARELAAEERHRKSDLHIQEVANKTERIETLEKRLDEKTEDLVNSKFHAVAADLKAPLLILQDSCRKIEKRLEQGDGTFDELSDKGHKIDLKTQQAIADVRNWAMEKFATKAEFERMREGLNGVEKALAKLEGQTQ